MKIVVCGGGTAGWLAALMLSSIHKNVHDITVVDSSKISIIGAGEGSTGIMADIIRNFQGIDYGCDETEFLKESNGTVKLGIIHKDWYEKGTQYIAPIDTTLTIPNNIDHYFYHALINHIPLQDCTYFGKLIDQNKTPYIEENKLKSIGGNAYHFDAHKVGKYFKKICFKKNVKHIDAIIEQVNVDDDGIKSLSLEGGHILEGDFFIDCTGFSRKLVNALEIKWISYSKNLPVNSAMPFLVDYKKDEQVLPVTLAWAQSAGWMWRIPTAERYGCGYVYDRNFISDEEAKLEIENSLGHKIEPIRVLRFDTGRLEKFWYKNCLALGLCSAFVEPLEATSIHSTIVQLNRFATAYLQESKQQTINSGSQNIYNKTITKLYEDIKDFLVLHYLGKRKDSEFWRWISTGETKTQFVSDILEMCKHSIPKHHHFESYFGMSGAPSWNWTLNGLGFLKKENAVRELKTAGFNDSDFSRLKLDYEKNTPYPKHVNDRLLTNNFFIRGKR